MMYVSYTNLHSLKTYLLIILLSFIKLHTLNFVKKML